MVTSSGKPTVIVPELSPTVTSFVVPENVIVPPKEIAVVLEPSATVIELFESLALAIEPANIAFVTEVFAIVTAPLDANVTSPDTATGLKLVPSATIMWPAVFVPIVISSPDTVRSPVRVTFLKPVISLFASTITALLAETVPAVTPSKAVSSPESIDVPSTISVLPERYKFLHCLSAAPKSKVLSTVGIKWFEILFGSRPPPLPAANPTL